MLRFVAALLALSVASHGTPLHPQKTTPQSFFRAEKIAVGGDGWCKIAAVHSNGVLVAGGTPGKFVETVNHRNGHSVLVTDTGSLHDESGFDGAIWDRQNGIVALIDLPSLLADAVTQAYVARDGWWDSSDAATMKRLPAPAGARLEGVQVTPAHGSAMEVWFDGTTHLIARTIAHTDRGKLTTEYSDWRPVDAQTGAVRLPFRQIQTDSTGAVTKFLLDNVTVAEALDSHALARPAAQPHGSLGKADSSTVPFQLTGFDEGHIVLPATVDGHAANILFDSGAANYFTPEAARNFGLSVVGGLNIGGVGTGSENGGFAAVKEISIGAAQLHEESVIVGALPYPATNPRAGIVAAGLAGSEFLSEFRTTINYAKRTITFAPFQAASPPDGATVPFLSDGHNIYIQATINGATGWFRVDTGDNGAVTVFQPFAEAHHLLLKGGHLKLLAGGVGGNLPTREFSDGVFTLAGTTFRCVPVTASRTRAGSFASRSIAGNLGADILSRFLLTFDYHARTLTLLPNPDSDAPFASDHTGLSVTQHQADDLDVLGVVVGSAAESAGVRAGDEIVRVDGASVLDMQLGIFDLVPLRHGVKPFTLTLQRGTETLNITINPRQQDPCLQSETDRKPKSTSR